ncbi:MAG: nitrogen-fixing NifU domain protein [Cereibacter sp.]|jgi:NifU-like protein|nr:nitrogen-fixing NifU domain protein [Cereibacter sp.]
MLDYTDQLRDHFFNPRNAGVLEAANAVGEAGSLAEGNAIRLMLRIDAATRIVEAARFQAFGGPAIAACSALTELVEGRTVDAALRLTGADIDAALGGLGERRHCADLGQQALQAALAQFLGVDLLPPKPVAPAAEVKILAPKHESRPKVAREVPLSPAEEAEVIASVIEAVRPNLRADGGDVTLLCVEGSIVRVHLTGNCSGCQLAALTLGGLQKRLADALGRPIRVVPGAAAPLVRIAGVGR